jgi:hypothetical protein
MFGLLPEIGGEVHVTVAGRNVAPRKGVRRHRIAAFGSVEVTKMRGIPLTSVARAICDTAATESGPSNPIANAIRCYWRTECG